MQMDGGIAYNDAARTQDICCWPLSSGRGSRAHGVGHGGPECPNSQVSAVPPVTGVLDCVDGLRSEIFIFI